MWWKCREKDWRMMEGEVREKTTPDHRQPLRLESLTTGEGKAQITAACLYMCTEGPMVKIVKYFHSSW